MDFDQLINNWHAKASDKASDEDYFSKFVFEYLCFIAFLKRKKYTDEDKDWKALKRLKNDTTTRDIYLRKIESVQNIQKCWGKIKTQLDERPLVNLDENTDEVRTLSYWECSCINIQDRRTHVCEEQGKIRNLRDWKNMVEFWHAIRNNLFHGGKNPDDARDQLLVENGFKTLNALMQILLSDENI